MNYNPFRCALAAAYAELSSPAARAYYSRRAQADTQTLVCVVVAGLAALFELSVATIEAGRAARRAVPQPEVATTPCTALALRPSTALAVRPCATPVPDDADVFDAEVVVVPALPSFVPFGLLPFVEDAVAAVVPDRFSMTLKELRAAAKVRGIKGYNKMSKLTLQALLAV